jgi:thiol:disulfide interchange protein DsbC
MQLKFIEPACQTRRGPSIALIALAMAASVAWAAPSTPTDAQDVRALTAGIDAMQRLPITGMQMIRAGGRVWYVSANGRYVFAGKAWDLWHGVELEGLDQAAQLAERIDLKQMRLNPSDLGAMDWGKGPEVLVFVDPLCPHCRALLDAMRPLTDRYRFRVVVLPALGRESESEALRLSCLAQTAGADDALQALLASKSAPDMQPACTQQALQRALITAQVLGVAGVPYLIAPDGRMRQGEPTDLAAWLEGAP